MDQNQCSENTQATEKDINEETVESQKRRKLKSKVWEHFTKTKGPNGDIATCNQCKLTMVGDSKKGTSHLHSHLSICPKRFQKDPRQMLISATKNASDDNMQIKNFKFDQERSRKDLARMIIKHHYAFNMVEHEYFQIFINNLQPLFKLVSRNTVRADVINVYQEEKKKLYEFLESLPSRITLTTDIWTSDHQNFAYICLTAHYINDEWKLKKKILAYKSIEYPHDGATIFRCITNLILDWNLDKKLFSMVVDNASSNDVMVRYLKKWLCDKGALPLGGDLFHVRCSSHILNLIVQDGLKVIGGLLTKIRESVRYLSRSPYAKQKFDNATNHVKLRGKKKVPMDVPNRWNSTFLMLEAALSLKAAFCRWAEIDDTYKNNPSEEEWEMASVIKECLKIFYNTTSRFCGTNFPTANIFFPDMCEIQLKLREWETSKHAFLRLMAFHMKEKFEKYREHCNMVLAVAVVLDPRFKMDLVHYYYNKIYGIKAPEYIDKVRDVFLNLYAEYKCDSPQLDPYDIASEETQPQDNTYAYGCPSSFSNDDSLSDFDKYTQARYNIAIYQKTEIEQYLDEGVFPRKEKFDILQWWQVNNARLPILARMARDILAVPATTIASEAAFSIGGRVIDESRASMLPDIVEALMTAGDWLECEKQKHVEGSSDYIDTD